jgi:hypothetical protein
MLRRLSLITVLSAMLAFPTTALGFGMGGMHGGHAHFGHAHFGHMHFAGGHYRRHFRRGWPALR